MPETDPLVRREGFREMPQKGDVYFHERLRGFWTVESAGPKFVTLKPSIAYLNRQRIPTPGFLEANWEKQR